MNEETFARESARIYEKQIKIEEEEKLKAGIKVPEKPDGVISYKEASAYSYNRSEYDIKIEMIDKRIKTLQTEIREIERELIPNFPIENVPIKVTYEDRDKQYNLLVTLVSSANEKRIKVEHQ